MKRDDYLNIINITDFLVQPILMPSKTQSHNFQQASLQTSIDKQTERTNIFNNCKNKIYEIIIVISKNNNVKIVKIPEMQSPHLKKLPYKTPLFKHCKKAQPFSLVSSSQQSTWYLCIENQQVDPHVHKWNSCKNICPAFDNQSQRCCFVVMEGICFQQFLLCRQKARQQHDAHVVMTQQEIWQFLSCVVQALCYLKEVGCADKLTHLKQYSIRRVKEKNTYKLIYHESMISQLESAQKNPTTPWHKLYLSPQQLSNTFISQKSIIFSLGVMLLNICSFQDNQNSIYKINEFEVDYQKISQKMHICRQVNGYSKIICNLIHDSLLDANQRPGFCQFRDLLGRKLGRIANQIAGLFDGLMVTNENGKWQGNVKYDLIFDSNTKMSEQEIDPFNKHSSNHKRTRSEQKDQKTEHRYLQQSAAQKKSTEKQIKQRGGEQKKGIVKLHRKGSKKFEGSKVAQNVENNKKLQKQNQKQMEAINNRNMQGQQIESKNEEIDSRFLFRGTFGSRHSNNCHINAESSTNGHTEMNSYLIEPTDKIKTKQFDVNDIQPIPSIQQETFIKQQRPPSNIAGNINSQKPTLSITPHYSIPIDIVQQPDTPKGFGKNRPFNPSPVILPLHSPQQIQQLSSSMKYLNLEYCLKPVQDLIQDLGKVGVWVQGDLYYGDFLNGRRTGLGLELFTNGQYYYGFFKEDLFSGEGLYFWTPNEYFFGYFSLGQKVYGRLQGEVQYQGDFKNNKRHGTGTCFYPSGQIYSGEWFNGKKHGSGTVIEPSGQKFTGYWNKGKRKGDGCLYLDSMSIKGYWNEQTIEGDALITYQNGDIFQGKVGKNLQKLIGKYASKSGRIFVGQFQNDQPKRGELIYSNGDKYIGELKNSKRHGYGQYYYVSGEIYKGLWENNIKKQ